MLNTLNHSSQCYYTYFLKLLKCIILIMLLQLSILFSSLFLSALYPPLAPAFSPLYLNACPGVLHISSLVSPFPILFLTSPGLFCSYELSFLIPAPFPPFSSFPLSADNPPNDLHTYDSVHVLVVCLVFILFLDSVVDSCEFVAFLMFMVVIFFLFF